MVKNEREFARRDQVWATKDGLAKWLGYIGASSGVGTFVLTLVTIWARADFMRWVATTGTVFVVFVLSVLAWLAIVLDYRKNERMDEE